MAKTRRRKQLGGGTLDTLTIKLPQMTTQNAQEIKRIILEDESGILHDLNMENRVGHIGELEIDVDPSTQSVKFTQSNPINNDDNAISKLVDFGLKEMFTDSLSGFKYQVIEKTTVKLKRKRDEPDFRATGFVRRKVDDNGKKERDLHAKKRLTMRQKNSAVLGYAKKPVAKKFIRGQR